MSPALAPLTLPGKPIYTYICIQMTGRMKEFGDYDFFFYFVFLHLCIEQTPCNNEIMQKLKNKEDKVVINTQKISERSP